MADRTSARAVIRITAVPDSGLSRALKGTVAASMKAQNDIARGQERSDKQRQRSMEALERWRIGVQRRSAALLQRERDREAAASKHATDKQAREARKLADAEVREAKRSADLQAKEAERLARYKMQVQRNSAAMQARENEKSLRAQVRDAQKAMREQQAVSRQRKDALIRGGALVAGAAGAAFGRVQAFAGAYGARSSEDLATKAVDFRRRSILVADMAGVSAEQRDAMQRKVLSASARTGVDATDILAGLETAQDRFSALEDFTAIIDDLANVSVATGTSVESVVGAMGVMRRQFELSNDEMLQLGGAMVQAADLGNISFQDVADNFAAALGAMGRNANLKGMAGAKQALGITQLLGTSDMSAPEAATLGVRVVSALNDVKIQDKLRKKFGVQVTEGGVRGGALRSMPDVVRELVAAGFMDANKGALRQDIFREERGQRGIEVLATAFQRDPAAAAKLLDLDPATGQAAIDRRVAAMNEGTLGKAATMGARNFQEFMAGGGMQRFLDVTVQGADALQKLHAQYPMLAETLGVTTEALKAFGAMLVLQTLFGRRGVGGGALPMPAALGAGGGGIMPVGAPAAAGGVGAMSLANVAAISIATFAGSFYLTKAALEMTGGEDFMQKLGAKFFELLNGDHAAGTLGRQGHRGTVAQVAGPQADPFYRPAFDFAAASGSGSGAQPLAWDMTNPLRAMGGSIDTATKAAPAASLKIEVVGPGRVISTKSNDGFREVDVYNGPMNGP